MSPITEDELRARLSLDPTTTSGVDFAPDLVRRGRRKRVVRRATAGAALSAALVAVVWGSSLMRPTAAPVVPAGSHSLVVQPSASPTTSATPSSPSAPTSAASSAATAPATSQTPRLKTERIALPREGWKTEDFVKEYGVFVTGDLTVTEDGLVENYAPCAWGEPDSPMPVQPATWRTIGSDSGTTYREGIIVFGEEVDAIRAMDWLFRTAVGCPADSPSAAAVDPLQGDWAEGYRIKSWTRAPGFYVVVHVIRQGAALAWTREDGDGGLQEPQVTRQRTEILVQPLRDMAPLMCRYTSAGC